MKVIKCSYTKNGDTCVSKTLVYLNFYRVYNQEQPIKKNYCLTFIISLNFPISLLIKSRFSSSTSASASTLFQAVITVKTLNVRGKADNMKQPHLLFYDHNFSYLPENQLKFA